MTKVECGHSLGNKVKMKRIDTIKSDKLGTVRTYECPECGRRLRYFPDKNWIIAWKER